jgi:hypothetical protein
VNLRVVTRRTAPLLALIGALGVSVAPARAEMPRSAAAFRDSVGVNTHVNYYDTTYGQWSTVVAKLDALGITHLRDNAFGNPAWRDWNKKYNGFVQLAAARGMRFNMIAGKPGYTGGTIDQLLAAAAGPLNGAVESFEGPNEFDLSGSGWAPALRGYQQELYAKVKAHPSLRHLPVLGPSLVYAPSRTALGNLSGSLDMGNMHPYRGGETPSADAIRAEMALASKVSADKPVMATEAGYHNAMAATSGQPPVPEAIAAVYTLRTYLEHFRAGVRRTYLYELIDQKANPWLTHPEQHFGLLRADYSEKPAFRAIKNMLAVVGPATAPGALRELPLAVSGDVTGVAHLLLQRADGTYVLALWQTGSLWDLAKRADRAALPTRRVLLDVPGFQATVHHPVTSDSGVPAAAAPDGIAVAVGNEPVLVELVARGSATGAPEESPSAPAEGKSVTQVTRDSVRTFVAATLKSARRTKRGWQVAVRRAPGAGLVALQLVRKRTGSQERVLATASRRVRSAGETTLLRLGRSRARGPLTLRLTFETADGRRTSAGRRVGRG